MSTDSLKIYDREGGEQKIQIKREQMWTRHSVLWTSLWFHMFYFCKVHGVDLISVTQLFPTWRRPRLLCQHFFRKFCIGLYIKSKQNSKGERKVKLLHGASIIVKLTLFNISCILHTNNKRWRCLFKIILVEESKFNIVYGVKLIFWRYLNLIIITPETS